MRWFPLGVVFLLALAVPAGAHATHVSVTPQVSPDGTVYVEAAAVVDPVWLVAHADDGDTPGRPVGWTLLDPAAGLHMDVPLSLSAGAWANVSGTTEFRIDLYVDDGDGRFDPGADTRLSQAGLLTPRSMPVRRGDRAYVGAGRERPQRTAGTVTVRRAILPADGHVVLRNDSGGDPGAVVGRTSLPAGNHSGVAVRLDEEFYDSRPSSFALWATLYVDDGDGRFDDGDDPIRVGETTVRSRFRLRKGNATPTPAEAALVTTPTAAPESNGEGSPGVTALAVGLVAALVSLVVLLVVGRYRG